MITADDMRKFKNQFDPELTVTYDGFVNNENKFIVSGLIVERDQGESVGSYVIRLSGAVASNYSISYVFGTFYIELSTAVYSKPASGTKNETGFGITIKENPAHVSTGKAEFAVRVPRASTVKIIIYDALGSVVFSKDVRTSS